MENKDFVMAKRIAAKVAEAGGRTYFVGGFVRDQLLNRENKDIDIEIHGISSEQLEEILDSLGERTVMGASFGIFGLRHFDLDIAMPRKETATGRGHKDFEVFVDPFIGADKAAERRDFTMNALMQDVLTGEILDFFGGQKDLENRVVRHVKAETFVEDPLRVLRAAQFAARFEFTVADDTVKLCSQMDLSALAKERIIGELEKALMKAKKPSIFFEEMRNMNQLSVWFPEVAQLADVKQDLRHHPEGNVWNHTMMVLDEAASLRAEAADPFFFMLSALCHDFGKIQATAEKDGRIHAYGHEVKGLPIVARFLSRLTNENAIHKYVLNMTEQHMKPNMMFEQHASRKAFMKMFDQSICPKDLILLAKADHLGRGQAENLIFNGVDEPNRNRALAYEAVETALREHLAQFEELMSRPFVRGADLVAAGVKPGPEFSDALDYAHKMRLAGVEKEHALKQTLAFLRKMKK